MNSRFYIFITIVRAPSGLVTTSATQPDSLQGEQEGGSEVLAVTEAAGGGEALVGLQLNTQGSSRLHHPFISSSKHSLQPCPGPSPVLLDGMWRGMKTSLCLEMLSNGRGPPVASRWVSLW